MTTANPFNKISDTCFYEILTYIFGDIFDQNGKHWLNNKSTEDKYYEIYKRINYNYNYNKYEKKWNYKKYDTMDLIWNMITISNLLSTSKELNKQVLGFMRHTGIVKTAIDYRNNWTFIGEDLTKKISTQQFLTNFINDVMFDIHYPKYCITLREIYIEFWVNMQGVSRKKFHLDRVKDCDDREKQKYGQKIWNFDISLDKLIFNTGKNVFQYCTHHWHNESLRCGNIVEYKYDAEGKRIPGQSFTCHEHAKPNIYDGPLVKPATIKYAKL